MDPAGPPPERSEPSGKLAGASSLWRAARDLGLVGSGRGDAELDHFVADDGQAIPVRILGDGPPVLLVHGLACSHRHWLPVARRLAKRHCVFAWDSRGHGACRPVATPVTLPRLAADIAALLDHYGLGRSVLVGHSMGALTVMQYLRDHGTARVAAAVFVDQSPRPTTDADWRLGLFGGCSADMLRGLIAGVRRDPAETLVQQLTQTPPPRWWHRYLDPDVWPGRALRGWLRTREIQPFLDLAESLVAADFRASLARMDAPLLVALGDQSPHYRDVPLEAWYRQTVPHCRISRYAHAGHSPHYTESLRFARELVAFIDDNS